MIYRPIIAGVIVFCWALAPAVTAVEYRLQVTHLERLSFSSYLESSRSSPRGQETMQRLETRLDRMEFPAGAVIPGRQVHLLDNPAYGGQVPDRVSFLPATGQQSWTTVVWDGTPGTRVAFVVRSDMVAWQEVWDVATNGTGVLRRLTLGGPGLFGGHSREVPAVPTEFLANAVDRGTYAAWVQQYARPVGGMYMVVGRRYDIYTSVDRVYLLLTLPPEPHTFKVVIGWKDHDDRGTGQQKFEDILWRP
jgi:hypothetical protein